MMKRLLFLALAACWMAGATAQAQNKYCKSYDDFVNDRWLPLDTVMVEQRSHSKKFWNGNDFNLVTGDKDTDQRLKKGAFAVMLGDSIYVNCRRLQRQKEVLRPGYAVALRYEGDKLCFVNRRWGHDELVDEMGAQLMFGLVGQAMQRRSSIKDRVCYVIDPEPLKNGYYEAVLVNDNFMDVVLKDDAALLEQYRVEPKKKKRTAAERVLPILREKGLVK